MTLAGVLQSPLAWLKGRTRHAVGLRLNREVDGYELKAPYSMPQLSGQLRKGDVVLVEGRLRISQLIKYATQSQWSHSALYVGDELLRRGGRLRAAALADFGPLADHLLIEALTDEGVIAVPLTKYRGHNIRICRPVDIDPADLERVVDSVVADLGKQYDDRNLVDLALMLLSPVKVGSLKSRTIQSCLGNCTDFQVICSGMIAKAFQRVGYPILPQIDVAPAGDGKASEDESYRLTMRHYSQILPRDFDLSPNFQIVKPEVGEAPLFPIASAGPVLDGGPSVAERGSERRLGQSERTCGFPGEAGPFCDAARGAGSPCSLIARAICGSSLSARR